jgi:hypothetical protein
MPNDACRYERITSSRQQACDCPHKTQRLHDVMSHRNINNMPERTDFRIENVIPAENNVFSQKYKSLCMFGHKNCSHAIVIS